MVVQTILEQLKEHCNCLPDLEDSVVEKSVDELIDLVSILTCWTQKPCETFLNSERLDVFDVHPIDTCSCTCDGDIESFELFYQPVQQDSLSVTVIEIDRLREKRLEVNPSDFYFSERTGMLKIALGAYTDFTLCECPKEYQLEVRYFAGYELIPDCLLPIFCDMFHILLNKNDCSCEKCQACSDEENSIVFDEGDDEMTISLYNIWESYLKQAYQKQLGLISLCRRHNFSIWGVVV